LNWKPPLLLLLFVAPNWKLEVDETGVVLLLLLLPKVNDFDPPKLLLVLPKLNDPPLLLVVELFKPKPVEPLLLLLFPKDGVFVILLLFPKPLLLLPNPVLLVVLLLLPNPVLLVVLLLLPNPVLLLLLLFPKEKPVLVFILPNPFELLLLLPKVLPKPELLELPKTDVELLPKPVLLELPNDGVFPVFPNEKPVLLVLLLLFPKDKAEVLLPKDGAEVLLPKDGVEVLLPNDGVEVLLPNDGADELLPNDRVEVLLPKDGGFEVEFMLLLPKALVLELPKVGVVDIPKPVFVVEVVGVLNPPKFCVVVLVFIELLLLLLLGNEKVDGWLVVDEPKETVFVVDIALLLLLEPKVVEDAFVFPVENPVVDVVLPNPTGVLEGVADVAFKPPNEKDDAVVAAAVVDVVEVAELFPTEDDKPTDGFVVAGLLLPKLIELLVVPGVKLLNVVPVAALVNVPVVVVDGFPNENVVLLVVVLVVAVLVVVVLVVAAFVVDALVVKTLVAKAFVVEALVVAALVVEALVVAALVVEALVVAALVVAASVVEVLVIGVVLPKVNLDEAALIFGVSTTVEVVFVTLVVAVVVVVVALVVELVVLSVFFSSVVFLPKVKVDVEVELVDLAKLSRFFVVSFTGVAVDIAGVAILLPKVNEGVEILIGVVVLIGVEVLIGTDVLIGVDDGCTDKFFPKEKPEKVVVFDVEIVGLTIFFLLFVASNLIVSSTFEGLAPKENEGGFDSANVLLLSGETAKEEFLVPNENEGVADVFSFFKACSDSLVLFVTLKVNPTVDDGFSISLFFSTVLLPKVKDGLAVKLFLSIDGKLNWNPEDDWVVKEDENKPLLDGSSSFFVISVEIFEVLKLNVGAAFFSDPLSNAVVVVLTVEVAIVVSVLVGIVLLLFPKLNLNPLPLPVSFLLSIFFSFLSSVDSVLNENADFDVFSTESFSSNGLLFCTFSFKSNFLFSSSLLVIKLIEFVVSLLLSNVSKNGFSGNSLTFSIILTFFPFCIWSIWITFLSLALSLWDGLGVDNGIRFEIVEIGVVKILSSLNFLIFDFGVDGI